jgi:hypothetical protein
METSTKAYPTNLADVVPNTDPSVSFIALLKTERPKRTHQMHILATEEEFKIWTQRANALNMNLSQYLRNCADAWTFRNNEPGSDGDLQQELADIRKILAALENRFKMDLPALLNQIATQTHVQPVDTRPIEERIQDHLNGRSLFLNQLATYCQAPPPLVLDALCRLRKIEMVKQDAQLRWSMK